MIVTSSGRPLKSTSISVMCLTLCFQWLEHQRKNLHFCQYSEYPQVRNALNRRASCLAFNSSAGSQPIERMFISYERPLNSTSDSVVKLGLSNKKIFRHFETRHFGTVFSCLTLNITAGTQPPKMVVTSSGRTLKSTSISATCLTLCFHWLEYQPKNLHFWPI